MSLFSSWKSKVEGAVGLRGFLFLFEYVFITCPNLMNDKRNVLVDDLFCFF